MLGAIRPASWRALCELIGEEGLGSSPNVLGLEGQVAIAAVSRAFASAPAADWVARLTALDIDCGQLLAPADVHDDPQLGERGMVVSGASEPGDCDLSFISSPLAPGFARAPVRTAPVPGQDTEAIMREIGIEEGAPKS